MKSLHSEPSQDEIEVKTV